MRRISPRNKTASTPRRALWTTSFGTFLGRRRVLVCAAIACFYITLSGHLYMANDDDPSEDKRNKNVVVEGGSADVSIELQEIARRTSHTYPPVTVNFTGYPLTREGMIATGAGMGRSVVQRFETKRQKAASHNNNKQETKTTSTTPFWWCRPRPMARGRFLQPANQTTPSTRDMTLRDAAPVEGLFFVKTPKTASQSINRILKRTITRVGARSGKTCHLRGHHIQGDPASWYGHRHAYLSVLITSLRDPVPRALSRIWWTLSTRQYTAQGLINVELLSKALTKWNEPETGVISDGQGGFQLNYISFPNIPPQSAWHPQRRNKVRNPEQVHWYVEQALQEYDFFLVQERLEESLVALQLLMGLETADILSMPLHVGGSYLYDRIAGCLELIPPPKLTTTGKKQSPQSDPVVVPFLKEYFQSQTWLAQNYGDYLLWGAAQASLDQTIQELGSARFGKSLKDFRRMQQAVLETCSKQVVFPCSVNGTIQREDYQPGNKNANGDRYPQADIEACIDQVVAAAAAAEKA